MEQEYFNLYELVRWIYLNKYISIFEPNKQVISKDELEHNYHRIPQKDSDKSPPLVVAWEDIKRANHGSNEKPIQYVLFEQNKDQTYIIIPEKDLKDSWEQLLLENNWNKNTKLTSNKISDKNEEIIYNQFNENQKRSKPQPDQQLGPIFGAFRKRFERNIKVLLDNIFGMSNALHLFKENGTYKFTLSDCQIFNNLYNSYQKQGKYFIRQEYEKLSPGYIELLLDSIELINESHSFSIDVQTIKANLNTLLLKAYKRQLNEDFCQLETLIQQITKIEEDDSITEKIEFIQSSSDSIMDLYQVLFNDSEKYLS